MSGQLSAQAGRRTPALPLPPRQDLESWAGYEYKLLSAEGLAVGELSELLARHRARGWELARLLLAEPAGRSADMTDLQDLGVLLRRKRRNSI